MPKYSVSLMTTLSLSITVEAENEEAAREEAYQEAPGICAQCSGWGRKYGMDIGEWTAPEDFFDDWTEETYGPTVQAED
jgi:hypothetical protein